MVPQLDMEAGLLGNPKEHGKRALDFDHRAFVEASERAANLGLGYGERLVHHDLRWPVQSISVSRMKVDPEQGGVS